MLVATAVGYTINHIRSWRGDARARAPLALMRSTATWGGSSASAWPGLTASGNASEALCGARSRPYAGAGHQAPVECPGPGCQSAIEGPFNEEDSKCRFIGRLCFVGLLR